MRIWCGIDLGQRTSRVSVIGDNGAQLANFTIQNSAVGVRELQATLRGHTRSPRRDITIAMEDRTGLLPRELLRSGYRVVPIHPAAVSRYRQSLTTSGSKSDRYDAFVLASLARLEPELHRPMPRDSDLVAAIRTLARAQQQQVWVRVRVQSHLHALFALYYPGMLDAFQSSPTPKLGWSCPSLQHLRWV